MAEWKPGQVILGEYQIERELGRGGMGCVWLVKSTSTGHRFAVKRALLKGEGHRKAFLAELQTWIDLPEHPNLVPCRFFRTTADEVLIFAEYVDGKSLKEWIDSGRLYEGGHAKALGRMLDVAIQFAWGLHCIHELGLVHQDVKPGNVLMDTGQAVSLKGMRIRVTDFGLARAKAAGEQQPEACESDADRSWFSVLLGRGQQNRDPLPSNGNSILVSYGGCTPAYCSPEQAAGRPVTRKTDIWSWGVSVLEMFTGGVIWQSGKIAMSALEEFTHAEDRNLRIPAIPESIVKLLRGCFQESPEKRWLDLGEVVEKLKVAYQSATREVYPRSLKNVGRDGLTPKVGVGKRQGQYEVSWPDPKLWVIRALRADGRDQEQAERKASELMAQPARSRRGKLLVDIAGYDHARQIYERLVKVGYRELENDLAVLCSYAAIVHTTVGDTTGAISLHSKVVRILDRLVNQEGRRDLAEDLARGIGNKAVAVGDLGDSRSALALFDQAIAIWESLVDREGQRELANDLAMAYMNKAVAASALGDRETAVTFNDQAIKIWERLVNQEGRRELAEDLAKAYRNKAGIYKDLGDSNAAIALSGQAIEILERLVNREDRRELANDLGNAYANKAALICNSGDVRAAIALYDRAIEIQERLVNQEGRLELAAGLAMCYMDKANAVRWHGDNRSAIALHDQAIKIWERLVNQEGRREKADDLARAYMNQAVAIGDLGDNRRAISLYDQAINIWERLVNQEGHQQLAESLAMTYMNRAISVSRLGDNRAAIAMHGQAIKIWERLVNQQGRHELADDLALAYFNTAIAYRDLGDNRGAIPLYDLAIGIRDRLVTQEGRKDLRGDLAKVRASRAFVLTKLGEIERGRREATDAIRILREEIQINGRADLKGALESFERQFSSF